MCELSPAGDRRQAVFSCVRGGPRMASPSKHVDIRTTFGLSFCGWCWNGMRPKVVGGGSKPLG